MSANNKSYLVDLEMKHKLVKQHESGRKVKDVARDLKLSNSTISTILESKDRILEAVQESACMQSTVITKQKAKPSPLNGKVIGDGGDGGFDPKTNFC